MKSAKSLAHRSAYGIVPLVAAKLIRGMRKNKPQNHRHDSLGNGRDNFVKQSIRIELLLAIVQASFLGLSFISGAVDGLEREERNCHLLHDATLLLSSSPVTYRLCYYRAHYIISYWYVQQRPLSTCLHFRHESASSCKSYFLYNEPQIPDLADRTYPYITHCTAASSCYCGATAAAAAEIQRMISSHRAGDEPCLGEKALCFTIIPTTVLSHEMRFAQISFAVSVSGISEPFRPRRSCSRKAPCPQYDMRGPALKLMSETKQSTDRVVHLGSGIVEVISGRKILR